MRYRTGPIRRALATVALALAVTGCTPQAWTALAFQAEGATPAEQAAAWRVAAGPASCGSTGESGGNPTARNGVHVGLFQLSGTYHRARAERLGFTWEQVATQPFPNARVAADLWREQGWRPWSCRP